LTLIAASPAIAATGVDLFDDRKAIDKGFDIIYEVRIQLVHAHGGISRFTSCARKPFHVHSGD
jgi:hypothetical protein